MFINVLHQVPVERARSAPKDEKEEKPGSMRRAGRFDEDALRIFSPSSEGLALEQAGGAIKGKNSLGQSANRGETHWREDKFSENRFGNTDLQKTR